MRNAEVNRRCTQIHVRRKREFISQWKSDLGCRICGERDPIVLDMNHLEPNEKNLVLRRQQGKRSLCQLSWPDLLVELEKCEVLCANCHRRVTQAQRLAGVFMSKVPEEQDVAVQLRLVVNH